MAGMNPGFAKYLANKKAMGSNKPAPMSSHKVGSGGTPKHKSSGKMGQGSGVTLGTTVHQPGEGHSVNHPL